MGTGSKQWFKGYWSTCAGAALLEVVVAITILGVILPAGLVVLSNGYRQYTQTTLESRALQIAQQRLEMVRAYRDARPFWYRTIRQDFGTPENEGKFRIEYDIRTVRKGQAHIPMWRVRVTVTHPDLSGAITLTNYFSRYIAQ